MTRSLEAAAHEISPDSDPDSLGDNEPKTHRSLIRLPDVDNGVFRNEPPPPPNNTPVIICLGYPVGVRQQLGT